MVQVHGISSDYHHYSWCGVVGFTLGMESSGAPANLAFGGTGKSPREEVHLCIGFYMGCLSGVVPCAS